MKNVITILSLIYIMWSCGSTTKSGTEPHYDTLYSPKYAERFAILASEDSVVLRIINPWQGASDVVYDYSFPRNPETRQRIICMSSSHVAFLDAIGAVGSIVGVSGVNFITNSEIHAASTPDIGYDNNLNFELVVSLKPDFVFVYEVAGENSATTKKLQQLDIPVVYIADYLEQSPLARSEWIVAFGAVTGRIDRAESMFDSIAMNYNRIKDSIANIATHRPKVMLNSPYRDVWYVPGDRNYIVQLINDAGGDYLAKGVDNDISRPISTEVAYKLLSEAEMWLNPSIGANSISDIKTANPGFANLSVVKKGEIYNNNARSTPEGGSDFWESGSLRADLVLQDLAIILHPDRFEEEQLFYYQRLK